MKLQRRIGWRQKWHVVLLLDAACGQRQRTLDRGARLLGKGLCSSFGHDSRHLVLARV